MKKTTQDKTDTQRDMLISYLLGVIASNANEATVKRVNTHVNDVYNNIAQIVLKDTVSEVGE